MSARTAASPEELALPASICSVVLSLRERDTLPMMSAFHTLPILGVIPNSLDLIILDVKGVGMR